MIPVAMIGMILPSLVTLAEMLFSSKPKSGAEKKAAVTAAAKAAMDTLQTYSKGGQKNTWDKIAPDVSKMIDSTANILFQPGTRNIEDTQSAE